STIGFPFMDATASTRAPTASLQTFKICRVAFTRIAGVTIPGHFVTGYRRPRAFRLPAPRVQRVFYPHRGRDHSRPLFTNRLNYPTQTPFLSRPRTMQPAATNH